MSHPLSTRLYEPLAVEARTYVRRPWVAVSNEHLIAAALDTSPRNFETIAMSFTRLEQELAALFAALPLAEARELHCRLANPAPDDPLAARFGRMIVERRQRLLGFLADAPRRAALGRRR